MIRKPKLLALAACIAWWAVPVFADSPIPAPPPHPPGSGHLLTVGPGKQFARPSQAIAAAHDGDTIEIDADGNYENDVASIRKNNLTIEGVGGMAKIVTDGRVAQRKGIWVFEAGFTNLTVKNLDFEGARVSDADGANGAGIRAQGTNLTVIGCRFYNNQDGILGGMGTTVIEHCEFDHNGLTGLTHNAYIGDQKGTLFFLYNYSHDTVVGHLLKSRDAVNYILYNRLTDNAGTGSYELDLPNGGFADIIGNVIQQSAGSQNSTILAYGEEGVVSPKSELNVINNTFVNDRGGGIFINAGKLPDRLRVVVLNNIFAGPGTRNIAHTDNQWMQANVQATISGAGFRDPAHYDYHLTAGSPAIGRGIRTHPDAMGNSLVPTEQYVDPCDKTARSRGGVDAGAFAFERPSK
ncbi:MAG TPA: right-handed parallel beta-helix repeat-containing protein [Tepidisphaeraceae bacterium]|nr:right-handed parallel beta-helix repeat-containing protein [Tepidisphaeraceae bacterium]